MRRALALFTILPVRREVATRDDARVAMLLLPLVGVLLGGVAAGVVALLDGALGAVAGVAALAYLTRGLHLDGLADTTDGLGSLRPPAEALEVMRRSDVGPLGVVTVVLTLLLQVACVARTGGLALLVAVVAGRVAAVLSCTPRTPAASGFGLGALVAGTVPRAAAFGWAVAVAAGAMVLGWRGPVAVVAGLAAAHLLRARAVRRLGGITGDVLGAQVEVATTVALFVSAL